MRTTGGVCTVCTHPDRDSIDAALVEGRVPIVQLARMHGLGRESVRRHLKKHVPERLLLARGAQDVATAGALLEQLEKLQTETAEVLRQAKEAKDHKLSLLAIARAEKQLELQARLTGELKDGSTTNFVNLQLSPETIERMAEALLLRRGRTALPAAGASGIPVSSSAENGQETQ